MEFISGLEEKVDRLIESYNNIKAEKQNLESEISAKNEHLRNLEEENGNLRNEIENLRNSTVDQQGKLDTTADKVRELISKLEAVELS